MQNEHSILYIHTYILLKCVYISMLDINFHVKKRHVIKNNKLIFIFDYTIIEIESL